MDDELNHNLLNLLRHAQASISCVVFFNNTQKWKSSKNGESLGTATQKEKGREGGVTGGVTEGEREGESGRRLDQSSGVNTGSSQSREISLQGLTRYGGEIAALWAGRIS